MNYKQIHFKKALDLFYDGKEVYYTYHTSPGSYRYIGGLGLDHARRNKSWYKYYVEDVKSLDKLVIIVDSVNNIKRNCGKLYFEEDVKQSIKKFIIYLETETSYTLEDVRNKAEEIFGKGLVENG